MKILVLQIRRIGDVIMTTPLLRAIAGTVPGAVVHVCVDGASLPVVDNNPHVSAAIVTDSGAAVFLALRLRRERYDAVIDTLGTPASARLAFLSGAPVRMGFDVPWRRFCYTHALPPSRTHRYSALDKLALAGPLGIRPDDWRLELFPTDADEREAAATWDSLGLRAGDRVVAFSPVSRRHYKRWPAERFAWVCDWLADRESCRFLPLCAPGEEHMVEAVHARMRRPETMVSPVPRVPFGALMPLMSRCLFYFGNDNGLRHVAVAAGLPSAAVFGPASPVSWTPPGTDRHLAAGGGQPVDTVTVEDVAGMVTRLLAVCRPPGTLSPEARG
jgi:heptosyltransferase III